MTRLEQAVRGVGAGVAVAGSIILIVIILEQAGWILGLPVAGIVGFAAYRIVDGLRPGYTPKDVAPVATFPLVECRTCGVGHLSKVRTYRLSGPVVVIGYLLLVPSIFGILIGVGTMVSGYASGDASIAAMGQGVGIAMVVGAFVGGLFGWLLVMKKSILRCDHCRATVSAD